LFSGCSFPVNSGCPLRWKLDLLLENPDEIYGRKIWIIKRKLSLKARDLGDVFMEMMQIKLQLIRDLYERLDGQALSNPNHPDWVEYDCFFSQPVIA